MKLWPRLGLIAALVPGCGDGLHDEAYIGKPLFHLSGAALEESEAHRLAVFWVTDPADPNAWVESPGATIDVQAPSRYDLWIYETPEAATFGAAEYAVGLVAAYEDLDGDGVRSAQEPFVGSMKDAAVVWSAKPMVGGAGPTLLATPAGFSLVKLPLACGQTFDTQGSDCNVPLGIGCRSDEACAAGACIKDLVGAMPGNVCVLPVGPTFAECTPANARLFRAGGSVASSRLGMEAGWLRACKQDHECPRDGYSCGKGVGACLPEPSTRVELEDNFTVEKLPPVCYRDTFTTGGGMGGGEPPPPPPPPP